MLMNKRAKAVLVILVCIVVIGAVVMKTASKQSESITLGLMLPLTGDYSAAGQNMQKGMELALDQFRKKNPGVVIKTVVEDDAYDAKKGVSAYRKLMDLDHVDAILMLSTPVIDAIHEDVVKAGIPVIQLGVQTAGVADDNIFQFSPAAEAPIGYLANYLGNDSGFYTKKVAVVYDNSSAQISFFDAFKKGYLHEFTPLMVNGKDKLRGYATKIASENYDAVVIIESPENGALLTKEILTVDKTVPILAFDAQLQTGFADYGRILGDTNKINGAKSMWFKSGKTAEFAKLYKEKYGQEPAFLADFSYDMINVLLGKYDKNRMIWLDNIQKTNDPDGVSGSISFDEKGVRIQPMVITEVKGG